MRSSPAPAEQHDLLRPSHVLDGCGGGLEVGSEDADARKQRLVDLVKVLRSIRRQLQRVMRHKRVSCAALPVASAARDHLPGPSGGCGRLVAAAAAAGDRRAACVVSAKLL